MALQEIRLWLRSLIATENQIVILDGGDIGESINSDGGENDNQKTEVIPHQGDTTKGLRQAEEHVDLGLLDCVVYMTNTSIELKTLFDEYGVLVSNFQTKADGFVQKFNFVNRQNNPSGCLVLCKIFAKETEDWSSQLETFNNNFESKWNNVCSYIKMVPKDMISQDDKIIIKSSLATLRGQFFNMTGQTSELLTMIDKIPNIQKDFYMAIKAVKHSFVKFNKFLETAIINCEELENLFI